MLPKYFMWSEEVTHRVAGSCVFVNDGRDGEKHDGNNGVQNKGEEGVLMEGDSLTAETSEKDRTKTKI